MVKAGGKIAAILQFTKFCRPMINNKQFLAQIDYTSWYSIVVKYAFTDLAFVNQLCATILTPPSIRGNLGAMTMISQ